MSDINWTVGNINVNAFKEQAVREAIKKELEAVLISNARHFGIVDYPDHSKFNPSFLTSTLDQISTMVIELAKGDLLS